LNTAAKYLDISDVSTAVKITFFRFYLTYVSKGISFPPRLISDDLTVEKYII
jgi:hypothetical protein